MNLQTLRSLFAAAYGVECEHLNAIDAVLASKDAAFIDAAFSYYDRIYQRSEAPLLAFLRAEALAEAECAPLEYAIRVDINDGDPIRGAADRPHARATGEMRLDKPALASVVVNPDLLVGPAHVVAQRVANLCEHARRALLDYGDDSQLVLARARSRMGMQVAADLHHDSPPPFAATRRPPLDLTPLSQD